jgi:glycosyltransferase involved in cell wall biosynthesis
LYTANNAADYCERILRIVDDAGERRRLAQAGRERVLSHHSWPSSMRRLDSLIEQCRAEFVARRTPNA